MKKKYFYLILFSIFIGVSVLLQIDSFDNLKYNILKLKSLPFRQDYMKSCYYDMSIPKNWIFLGKDKNFANLLGPTWTKNQKEMTQIHLLQNFDYLERYIHLFDTNYCQDIDDIVIFSNRTIIDYEDKKEIEFEGKIIFCNQSKQQKSYVSYMNKGTITYLYIRPYDSMYKQQYIELFKKIHYVIYKDQIPNWINE